MSRFKKNYKRYLAVLIGLLIIGYFAYGRIQSAKFNNPLVFNPTKDKVTSPQIQTIKDELTLAGSIRADEVANLHFNNPGKLVWVGVKVGDRVKKWQAIASLDKAQLQKSLQTQYNNYRTSLSQFNDVQDQYKTAKDKLVVTDTIQRILDRTQYSLNNSVINYEITDMAIHDSVLSTPIAGVVTNVAQPLSGTYSTPTDTNFTIINPDTIYFRAEIDQDAVTKVKVGDPVTINLDSFPDQSIDSKINFIAYTPVAGQTSTVYEVRFDLPLKNDEMIYRWGMDGDATITLAQSPQALTVSTDAVNDDNGQRYVYLKANDRLIRQNIKTGIETDTVTQVTEGLSASDSVVIKSR